MKARTFVVFALAPLLYGMLTACAGAPLPSATSEASDVMAVPRDDGMLAQRLRRSLDASGWRLVEYDAAALEANRDYSGLARRAKYRLTLSGERIGNCRGGGPSFLYNVAVIDNATGAIGLALTGANCLDAAISRFEDGLERNDLVIPTIGAGG